MQTIVMNKASSNMTDGYVAALDIGDRRIGVALTSLIARLPAPYTTIDRQQVMDVPAWVGDFVKSNNVCVLVVGMPKDLNGKTTEQTAKVTELARSLEAIISIPIVMQEEAVTSIEAEKRLKNLGKPYSKADIDAEAACIILQDYLSGSGQRLV